MFEVRSLREGRILYRCSSPLSLSRYTARFSTNPSSNHGPDCPTRLAKFFVPDPAVNILVIVFNDMEGKRGHRYFTVILSVHLFLRKCQKLTLELNDSGIFEVSTLEWNQWGPDVTRWLPTNIHGEFGSRISYGARLATSLVAQSRSGLHYVHYNMLLDFNPRAIRRSIAEENNDEYSLEIIDGKGIWTNSEIVVESFLPYRAWVSKLEDRYWNLSLDANTIVARLVSVLLFVC